MKRSLLILILASAVIIAGCTEQLINGGGSGEQEEPPVVSVQGPTCEVRGVSCRDTSLTRYDGPVTVRFSVTNYGKGQMTVPLGSYGQNILVSRCNSEVAAISEDELSGDTGGSFQGGYTARKISPANENEVSTGDPTDVTLQNQETLELEWVFDIVPLEGTDVSRLGYTCPLDFSLSFNQTLETARQIQIRRDEEVTEVAQLGRRTSSKEPVRLETEFDENFVAQEGRSFPVRTRVRNVGPGTIKNVFYIDILRDTGLWSDVDGDIECTYDEGEQVQYFRRGDLSGQSDDQICRVSDPRSILDGSSSQVSWINVEARYSYEMERPSVSFAIDPEE